MMWKRETTLRRQLHINYESVNEIHLCSDDPDKSSSSHNISERLKSFVATARIVSGKALLLHICVSVRGRYQENL